MAFYQIVTVLNVTFSVTLPHYYTEWMKVFDVAVLDWMGWVVPEACLSQSFSGRLLIIALSPIALIGIVFMCLTIKAAMADSNKASCLRRAFSNGLLSTMPLALLVTFLLVPSVSASIFEAWSCEAFGFSASEDHYFLRGDPSIECYTSEAHRELLRVAFFLILLWPVGVLVLYAGLLIRVRKPILDRTPNRLVRSTAFLHRDYRPEVSHRELAPPCTCSDIALNPSPCPLAAGVWAQRPPLPPTRLRAPCAGV